MPNGHVDLVRFFAHQFTVVVFTTRGTTDTPLRTVAFATNGVKHFLEVAMKADTWDLLGKLEGFAVQWCGSVCPQANRVVERERE